MKASLTLSTSQQLALTPQLQQAIRLLQMSSLDLQQEIQDALESNALLESVDEHEEFSFQEQALDTSPSAEKTTNQQESDSLHTDHSEAQEWEEKIPTELALDTSWEDVYQTSASHLPSTSDEDWDYGANTASDTSLKDHLLWQLNLLKLSNKQQVAALALIDNLNEAGYFIDSWEQLLQQLQHQLTDFSQSEAESLLQQLQLFEPVGVFARSLGECLSLQLAQLPETTPWLAQAQLLCSKYLNYLSEKDLSPLLRRMRINQEQLSQIVNLLKTLDPKPGLQYETVSTEYIVPDLILSKVQDRWQVELNPNSLPRIRLSQPSNLASGNTGQGFVNQQLQEARWFIRSLQNRGETLLKVANAILEFQYDFFERGAQYMKPLVLADVAEVLEMHESTISRATAQKYMHTPFGVYELKYFFSSHVNNLDGEDSSSIAIKAKIQALIKQEDPKKTLSDSKLASLLEAEGINVARRTVAKYRESLDIPSSSDRKQRF